jgi:hypothetical protein
LKILYLYIYSTLFLTDRNEVYGQGRLRGNKREASQMEKIPLPADVVVKELIAYGDHAFILTSSVSIYLLLLCISE